MQTDPDSALSSTLPPDASEFAVAQLEARGWEWRPQTFGRGIRAAAAVDRATGIRSVAVSRDLVGTAEGAAALLAAVATWEREHGGATD
jgi:hypothetical protein